MKDCIEYYLLIKAQNIFFICMIFLYMLGMNFDLQSVIGDVQWHDDQNSCLRKLDSTVI